MYHINNLNIAPKYIEKKYIVIYIYLHYIYFRLEHAIFYINWYTILNIPILSGIFCKFYKHRIFFKLSEYTQLEYKTNIV